MARGYVWVREGRPSKCKRSKWHNEAVRERADNFGAQTSECTVCASCDPMQNDPWFPS
jgi:hypothetical protein